MWTHWYLCWCLTVSSDSTRFCASRNWWIPPGTYTADAVMTSGAVQQNPPRRTYCICTVVTWARTWMFCSFRKVTVTLALCVLLSFWILFFFLFFWHIWWHHIFNHVKQPHGWWRQHSFVHGSRVKFKVLLKLSLCGFIIIICCLQTAGRRISQNGRPS